MRRLFTGGNYGWEYKYRSAKEGQPDPSRTAWIGDKRKDGKGTADREINIGPSGNLRSDSNFGVYADTGQ